MKIERRRRYGQTLTTIATGELGEAEFDGYHFTLLIDGGGPQLLRVEFERHEAERFAKLVIEALELQRMALDQRTAIHR